MFKEMRPDVGEVDPFLHDIDLLSQHVDHLYHREIYKKEPAGLFPQVDTDAVFEFVRRMKSHMIHSVIVYPQMPHIVRLVSGRQFRQITTQQFRIGKVSGDHPELKRLVVREGREK
jgi:hypothetical protein